MTDISYKERAEKLRKRAIELIAQADILDPPYPCRGCFVGWGNVTQDSNGNVKTENCHNSCVRFQRWEEAQAEDPRPLSEFVVELEKAGEI